MNYIQAVQFANILSIRFRFEVGELEMVKWFLSQCSCIQILSIYSLYNGIWILWNRMWITFLENFHYIFCGSLNLTFWSKNKKKHSRDDFTNFDWVIEPSPLSKLNRSYSTTTPSSERTTGMSSIPYERFHLHKLAITCSNRVHLNESIGLWWENRLIQVNSWKHSRIGIKFLFIYIFTFLCTIIKRLCVQKIIFTKKIYYG